MPAPQPDPDQDTPLWRTVAKLVLLAVILIGGVGLALWYAGEHQESNAPSAPQAAQGGSGASSWGIAGDSPLRSKR